MTRFRFSLGVMVGLFAAAIAPPAHAGYDKIEMLSSGSPLVVAPNPTCVKINGNGGCGKYQGTINEFTWTLGVVVNNQIRSECTMKMTIVWQSPQQTPFYGGAVLELYHDQSDPGQDPINDGQACNPFWTDYILPPTPLATWTTPGYNFGAGGNNNTGSFWVEFNPQVPFPPIGTNRTFMTAFMEIQEFVNGQGSNSPCYEVGSPGQYSQFSVAYNNGGAPVLNAFWWEYNASLTSVCPGVPAN